MQKLVIYTKTGCPYCKKAMEDYKAKGIAFTEVNTSVDENAKKILKEEFKVSKVPVIVQDGKVIAAGYGGGG